VYGRDRGCLLGSSGKGTYGGWGGWKELLLVGIQRFNVPREELVTTKVGARIVTLRYRGARVSTVLGQESRVAHRAARFVDAAWVDTQKKALRPTAPLYELLDIRPLPSPGQQRSPQAKTSRTISLAITAPISQIWACRAIAHLHQNLDENCIC